MFFGVSLIYTDLLEMQPPVAADDAAPPADAPPPAVATVLASPRVSRSPFALVREVVYTAPVTTRLLRAPWLSLLYGTSLVCSVCTDSAAGCPCFVLTIVVVTGAEGTGAPMFR